MFIELIDLLRCPRDHEETWLVAALNAVQDRFVIKAKLGCPVCGENYFISSGIADLRGAASEMPVSDTYLTEEESVRVAGLLNLIHPGQVVALEGQYAAVAHDVSHITECRIIALNPSLHVEDSETVATVRCASRLPLAPRSILGAVITSPALIDDLPRVLRQSGRALVPVGSEIPAGLREMMRDDRHILAESVGSMVQLRR